VTKIIVVDDDPGLILIVSNFLEKEGFEVVCFESGEECLEKLEKNKPDLILMDIMMPGLDGWETTDEIKSNPATKDIPVVMLTVKGEREDKLKSFHETKCDGYIVKPVDRKELVKVVRWMTTK
jgi:CheY-like chemotaxis protein